MKEEIWKDIEGFPGYQVSSYGRVRSFWDFHGNITNKYRIMKQELNKDDYYQVTILSNDRKKVHKRIHRLVADAFLGPHPDLVTNHIDGNKHNNRLENLEWVTAEQNSTIAARSGLYRTKRIKIIETGEIFNSIKSCAEAIRVHPSDISHVLSGAIESIKGLHFEYVNENIVAIDHNSFLYDYQMDAVKRMKNGCILNGGVGSGKSRSGLFYYYKEQGGWIDESGYIPMKNPRDLYIITTARKRDTGEWLGDMAPFKLSTEPKANYYKNKVVVDSWNNIGKYSDVSGAFFIFDEQRLVGNGAWVKAFYKIAKKNQWILLTATAGDTWTDYIPVFVANGFYKNKTEFCNEHVVYSRFSKYPKIEKYIDQGRLLHLRHDILIPMDFQRQTVAHHEDIYVQYSVERYKDIIRNRWNPETNKPIKNASELCFLIRKVVNTDQSRQAKLLEILEQHPKAIIFYNFDYELDILKGLYYGEDVEIAEWNGHEHQPIPTGDKWVYLVQYTAGAEGWNCITTDTIIFFSQNYSYKIMQQAAGRTDRLNTPFTDLYYYHLKSRSGIDLAISKALGAKKKFNETKWVKW